MKTLLEVMVYISIWLTCGFLMSMHFHQYLCDAKSQCATCKEVIKRWHKWAWIMDGAIAVLAIILLIWFR